MAEFSFADRYSQAGLSPTPEQIATRKEAFDALVPTLTVERAIDLTRLYFDLDKQNVASRLWFKEAFAAKDISFTLVNNAREGALLASWLLEAGSKNYLSSSLVPLTAAFCGARTPIHNPDFIGIAANAADRLMVGSVPAIPAFKATPTTVAASMKLVDAQIATLDTPHLQAAFKQLAQDRVTDGNDLAAKVESALNPIRSGLKALSSEMAFLWWFEAKWSRVTNEPLDDVNPLELPLVVAFDAASLTDRFPPPLSAKAMMYRLLTPYKKCKKGPLGDSINAVSEELVAAMSATSLSPEKLADVCPVMFAIKKFGEAGADQWKPLFTKATGIETDKALAPIDLALQLYRELIIVAILDGRLKA